jgi:hypothetical protein
VAHAGLGTIHQVRACLDTMHAPVAVFLNRYDSEDPIAAVNLAWLRHKDGLDIVVDVGSLVERVCAPRLSGW